MKSVPIIALIIMAAFILTPVIVNAQSGRAATAAPPLSQPLVREGTLATKLADVLKVGPAANEAEAESSLSAVGIAPRNGWIADYPVTPDIAGELQNAINDATAAGRIPETKDSAARAFQDVMTAYNLSVAPGISNPPANEASPPAYPESEVINNYYYEEGPPVVTYYAPPPDYAYLYSWVPYPFWWWDFWFPGFFVLADFDRGFHGHHGRGHGDGGFFSNHFRDHSTGRMSRIDPANRAHGGTFADRGGSTGWTSPSARSGAQAIVSRSHAFAAARVNSPAISHSANGMSGPTSRNQASVSTAWKGTVAGAPAARTNRSSNFNSRRSFNQSTYRTSSSGQNGTYSRPAYRMPGNYSASVGGRSFSAPSVGSRSGGGSFGGMRGSFSGARVGGSFGGWRR
jgi:hypothetical protein